MVYYEYWVGACIVLCRGTGLRLAALINASAGWVYFIHLSNEVNMPIRNYIFIKSKCY